MKKSILILRESQMAKFLKPTIGWTQILVAGAITVLPISSWSLECTALKPLGQANRFPTDLIQCRNYSREVSEFKVRLPFKLNNYDQAQLLVGETDFSRRAGQLFQKELDKNSGVREINLSQPGNWSKKPQPIVFEHALRGEFLEHMSRTLGSGGAIRYHWRSNEKSTILENSVNKVCFSDTTVEELAESVAGADFCGNPQSLWDMSACDNPTVWQASGAAYQREINRFVPNNKRLDPPAPAMNIKQKFFCQDSPDKPLVLTAALRNTTRGIKNWVLKVDTEQVWEFTQEGTDACFIEHYKPLSDGPDKGKLGAGFTDGHWLAEGMTQDVFVGAHEGMVMILAANTTERLRQRKGLSNKFGKTLSPADTERLSQAKRVVSALPCMATYKRPSAPASGGTSIGGTGN